MATDYNDSSIELLFGAERIRKRPASMLGSSGIAGARHGFTEIYGNALDEHSAGFGDRLDVKYYADGSISLRDYGRGVPLGWNDNDSVKNWNWHVIYNELYGGGKYQTNQLELAKIVDWSKFDPKAFVYLFSVGLNGLGAASTQYTSEYFEVKSYRDGICKSRSFRKGIPLVNGEPFDMFKAEPDQIASIPEEITETSEPNGTFIHWKPDAEVFDDVNIGSDWLLETCKDVAGVAGIELHFDDENTGQSLVIEAGNLASIVREHCGNSLVPNEDGDTTILTGSAFDHGHIKVENKDFIYVCMLDYAIGFTKSEVKNSCYHNSVKMHDGMQYMGVQDAISTFLIEKGRAEGVKVDKRDYMDSFNVAISTYSNYASFRGQTKDAVDDVFIYNIIKDNLLQRLRVEFGKGNKAVCDVVARVIDEARIRIETQELQSIARKASKVKKEKAPEKFTSCDAYESKNYEEVELWITEGDSAAGSVINARNSKFQAVFPIRGKGLNVAKASIKRVLANKEIRELFAILGTGFDLNIKGEKFFNIEDLKVGKIIIATDADEDGYQIRVLLFLTFYKLAPQLLTAGKVFVAETPRFNFELTDGSMVFARNDAQRDEMLKEYAGRISNITRYKGLGKVEPEVLRETTVHPDTRQLIQLNCDFSNQVECDLIDALFGADKYNQRKAIISEVLGTDVSSMIEDTALLLGEIDDMEVDDETEYEEIRL